MFENHMFVRVRKRGKVFPFQFFQAGGVGGGSDVGVIQKRIVTGLTCSIVVLVFAQVPARLMPASRLSRDVLTSWVASFLRFEFLEVGAYRLASGLFSVRGRRDVDLHTPWVGA